MSLVDRLTVLWTCLLLAYSLQQGVRTRFQQGSLDFFSFHIQLITLSCANTDLPSNALLACRPSSGGGAPGRTLQQGDALVAEPSGAVAAAAADSATATAAVMATGAMTTAAAAGADMEHPDDLGQDAAAPATAAATKVARRLEIDGRLGSGADGFVFVGRCGGEPAVVKVFDWENLERCWQEEQAYLALAAVQGSAIPRLLHSGEMRVPLGYRFLVLQYIEGAVPLSEMPQPLPEEVCTAARRALCAAHAACPGLLHGDLRLENILLLPPVVAGGGGGGGGGGGSCNGGGDAAEAAGGGVAATADSAVRGTVGSVTGNAASDGGGGPGTGDAAATGAVAAERHCMVIDWARSHFNGTQEEQAQEQEELRRVLLGLPPEPSGPVAAAAADSATAAAAVMATGAMTTAAAAGADMEHPDDLGQDAAAPATAAATKVARRLEIDGRLGSGADGFVFVGRCGGEPAVVKVFDWENLERCWQEEQAYLALAAVQGSAIPRLLHSGEMRVPLGYRFLVLQYIEGAVPLSEMPQPLPEEVCTAARRALCAAHAACPGLLHGDLRLENILLLPPVVAGGGGGGGGGGGSCNGGGDAAEAAGGGVAATADSAVRGTVGSVTGNAASDGGGGPGTGDAAATGAVAAERHCMVIDWARSHFNGTQEEQAQEQEELKRVLLGLPPDEEDDDWY